MFVVSGLGSKKSSRRHAAKVERPTQEGVGKGEASARMGERLKAAERPEVKTLARETSLALTRVDPEGAAELAQVCEALQGEPLSIEEARDAVAEMAVLGRVLQATRDNIRVMQRLRDLRLGRIEYKEPGVTGPSEAESGDGHD